MKHEPGMQIALSLVEWLASSCEVEPITGEALIVIAGGLRRGLEMEDKPDVHDIEIVAQPTQKSPPLAFGQKPYATFFDKMLSQIQEEGYLGKALKNGPKLKQYEINLPRFGIEPVNEKPFKVEFYLVTPPAQFGVDLVIRTGPGKEEDNFSQWVVTSSSKGGALPDGYRVKYAAVWRVEQFGDDDEPMAGELPLLMPDELDFFKFIGMEWIPPAKRHAMWKKPR
jgi:DNA polymerase/3'-5' exonuclease PolX